MQWWSLVRDSIDKGPRAMGKGYVPVYQGTFPHI